MYKVIIIDDEEVIIEGLKRVIDWEKYNCSVVASAFNAKDGIKAVHEHHPDILFTDIKMPNLDGLTMIAGLKGEFPDMQIAVLTGYRDFEYAQRAVNIGVTRFLLKPSKMIELEETLTAMTQNLRKIKGEDLTDKSQNPVLEEEQGMAANNFIFQTAMNYIKQHYTEKFTLTELAEQIHVSKWHLSKLLNKYTGKSFSDLINQSRINKAKELLVDPAMKIHQISEVLGFADVTHFSRIFKKLQLVSPNEYRNSLYQGDRGTVLPSP